MYKQTLLAAALMLTVTPAHGQALPDPTERTTIVAQRVGAPSSTPRWVLESTLVADDRRVAVINGQSVTVGDSIRGAQVLRIDTYGVRLRTAGGTIELTLSGSDPKRAAGGGAPR